MLVETKEDERGEYTRGLLNQTVLGLCTTIGSFWTTLLHGPEYNYGALDLNHLCTIPHRTTITPTYLDKLQLCKVLYQRPLILHYR